LVRHYKPVELSTRFRTASYCDGIAAPQHHRWWRLRSLACEYATGKRGRQPDSGPVSNADMASAQLLVWPSIKDLAPVLADATSAHPFFFAIESPVISPEQAFDLGRE
jgi:hypothetical protein